MDVVVDANILFAAVLKDGTTRELFLNDELHLYSPEYLVEEFIDHIDELEQKAHTPGSSLKGLAVTLLVKSTMIIVTKNELIPYLKKACRITPDPDDALYLATALRQHCSIWSNDSRLKKQTTVRVYTTHELLDVLQKSNP